MALVIESFCVVLRCEALETRWPGGLRGFESCRPNNTFCTDGVLCRVSFMAADDARAFVARLADHGIEVPSDTRASDATIFDDRRGSWFPAPWLASGQRPFRSDGETTEVLAVWLRGSEPGPVQAPPGFVPGQVAFIGTDELHAEHELVSSSQGIETWRHKRSGKLRYVGRSVVADGQRLADALRELSNRVWSLAEPHDAPLSTTDVLVLQAAAVRAEELEAAMINDPRPAVLRGVAARRLGLWSKAEVAFRRVTALRPTYVGGWLDLTWALAEQGRHQEALGPAREALALEPDSLSAIGNLAATLWHVQAYPEAHELVARGLHLDPEDRVCRHLQQKLAGAPKPRSRPWWKRLFGW